MKINDWPAAGIRFALMRIGPSKSFSGMKSLRGPDPGGTVLLDPAEMNKIRFGGNRTSPAARKLKVIAEGVAANPSGMA